MKRALALILAFVLMATLIIGCGKGNTDTSTDTSNGTNNNTNTSTNTDIVSPHTYQDDGDCTTAEYCTACGELALEAREHDFSSSLSYSLRDDSFLQGGTRNAKCVNDDCEATAVLDVNPFIETYGYSVTEYDKNDRKSATITASFAFNKEEIDNYASYLSDTTGKTVKIEYGIIGYIKRMVKFQPVRANGKTASYVIKANFSGFSGINDFSIPGIGSDFYGEEIIICSYIIIGDQVYFIQGNELITDYTQLTSATAEMLLKVAK